MRSEGLLWNVSGAGEEVLLVKSLDWQARRHAKLELILCHVSNSPLAVFFFCPHCCCCACSSNRIRGIYFLKIVDIELNHGADYVKLICEFRRVHTPVSLVVQHRVDFLLFCLADIDYNKTGGDPAKDVIPPFLLG
jgi:hypothetical protein